MKLFEMHLHTTPVSRCSYTSEEEMAEKYASIGFGGAVLTNHYSDAYTQQLGVEHEKQMEEFVASFRRFEKACRERGLRAFFGAEVAVRAFYSEKLKKIFTDEQLYAEWSEYLIYGLTEEIILSSPRLCDMTQKELFAFCNKNGLLMLQSHPYRTMQGHSLKDINYLHGLEINTNYKNITPGDGNRDEIYDICRRHNLIAVAGGDIHQKADEVRSGTYLPDEIRTNAQLVEYLKRIKTPEIEILPLDKCYEPLTKVGE